MNHQDALARIRVVLSHPQHPGNIGSAARAMKTMGLSRLLLVNPVKFPNHQATWLASSAADLIEQARVCTSLEEALASTTLSVGLTTRIRDLSHNMLALREAAPMIVGEASHGEVALIFGNEVSGLSNAELDKCQLLVSIPANPEYTSLNLAAAVQVVTYEIRMAAVGSDIPMTHPEPMASHAEIEFFYRHLEDTLLANGFLDPEEPKRLMRRLRRLFSRARLEKKEVDILRGILGAIQKSHEKTVD